MKKQLGTLGPFLFNFIYKKTFMAPFYGWSSTTSRLAPLQRSSLLSNDLLFIMSDADDDELFL